jgi:hypothetical protein
VPVAQALDMALEMREGNPEVTVIDECALSQRIDLVLREIQIYYGDAHPDVLMVVDRIACLKVPSTTSEAWEMATTGDIASFSFFILFTSGCYSVPFPSWFWAIRGVTSPLFDFTFDSNIVFSHYRDYLVAMLRPTTASTSYGRVSRSV